MSNEIYNEGRVVGYSSEELFDRLFKDHFPNDDVPTTQEWLSTSMGMGASFALHINKTTTAREVVTYNFFTGSGANSTISGLSGRYLIIATPIFGTPTYSNTQNSVSIITDFDAVKTDMSTSYSFDVSGYSKILNGIIDYKNVINNETVTTVKLLIDGACTCDILFTGFLNAKILETMKLSAGTEELGGNYINIDDFGNSLLPDISQIHFARPNYKESFTADVIDTDSANGSMIDISQVSGASTLSTSASIITPTSKHYSNQGGKDNANLVPNLFSVQQHTNGSTKINPSLYFYNPSTGNLEPVDSDAKGAVNIIKRDTSPAETETQLRTRLANMSAANTDKIFIGAWVETSTPNVIEYLIFPGNDEHFEGLGDLLSTLKNSGEGTVRIYASQPSSVNTNYTNYGIWD